MKVNYLAKIYIFFVLLVALQVTACAEEQSNSNIKYSDLQKFWSVFRDAALKNDITKLEKLTKFPVAIHGMMDDDPIIKIEKKLFFKNINIVLSQDPGDPSTGSPETSLDLFKRTKEIKDLGGLAHIGDFEFHKVDGYWWLVRLYISY